MGVTGKGMEPTPHTAVSHASIPTVMTATGKSTDADESHTRLVLPPAGKAVSGGTGRS